MLNVIKYRFLAGAAFVLCFFVTCGYTKPQIEAPKVSYEPAAKVTSEEKAEIRTDIRSFVSKINGIINDTNNSKYQYNKAKEARNLALREGRGVTAKKNEDIMDRESANIERQYHKWEQNLTERYKAHFSNPAVLERFFERSRVSGTEELRNALEGKSLKNLKDYYVYVVCTVRKRAQVDEIDFIDNNKNRVKVLTRDVDNHKVFLRLYDVVREKDGWKIDLNEDVAAGRADF